MSGNPVVAVLPVKGWYAVFALWDTLPQDGDRKPYAAPIEHATVHADGTRKLWTADHEGVRVVEHYGNYEYLCAVQAVTSATHVYLRTEFTRPVPVMAGGLSLVWNSEEYR